MRGYFQSYKYFEGYNFGRIFFKDLSSAAGVSVIPDKKPGNIGIHVRKGDYELYPTKHPVVSVDYISDAITRFSNNVFNNKFIFYSDNPDWCGHFAHIKKLSCSVVFEYDPVKCFIELMSNHHFILSNSTFGYWAAIMNQWLYVDMYKTAVVIYPEKWFGSDYAHMDTKDLCPPEWIKM